MTPHEQAILECIIQIGCGFQVHRYGAGTLRADCAEEARPWFVGATARKLWRVRIGRFGWSYGTTFRDAACEAMCAAGFRDDIPDPPREAAHGDV